MHTDLEVTLKHGFSVQIQEKSISKRFDFFFVHFVMQNEAFVDDIADII